MASVTVLDLGCEWANCVNRATRRVLASDGTVNGDYCTKHAQMKLVDLSRKEQRARRNSEEVVVNP